MADHEATTHAHHHEEDPQAHATRRAILQAALGVSAGATLLSTLWVGASLIPREEKVPSKEPVAVGDVLVFATGPKANQEITLDDLRAAQREPIPFIIAFPKSPQNVVKKDLITNTIMVILADPARMSPETRQHASPEGVLAYSAVCKHLGCTVSQWQNGIWRCPCHGGEYDIYNQAKVVGGPVPKPVPQLPVKVEGGRVVVAGEFTDKPGADV
ncbi:Cytochrome bc1 complex Rieske iron-sulfur subunit [Meiothermus luteus]|jgi:rieske iron-sulfur protein|uniref:Cytochrome bc1 complex Rieske iron-sulfur subunit n=1 Tax=Meiothermus luteus TaxID=2026184 RepID=A0A399EU93_9DEIN|nr:ubiquinol-cytochrome c reductase iron-sulfur subunit [Meiothermus luteus]RIH87588.1 Cytochrome bc1 complex Rieske iron-sulfur subunit [Meiothermus luteus]RMH58006.1 MAG: ubiquinol-cytochrome c reductase iron-sulfur subunit [Deinococcota bacterium]